MNKQEIETAIDDLEDLSDCITLNSSAFGAVHGKNLKVAISALQQQLNNGWTPVSERLPQNGINVIVSCKDCSRTTAWYNVITGIWKDETGFILMGVTDVIAWQPLPEPYQEGI